MKKFFSCFALCFVIANISGMGLEPGPIDRYLHALRLREMLTPGAKEELTRKLIDACYQENAHVAYNQVEELLQQGADPNYGLCGGKYKYGFVLSHAAAQRYPKLVFLLLKYGCDPQLDPRAITVCQDIETARLLMRAGLDINTNIRNYSMWLSHDLRSLISSLCEDSKENITLFVWSLLHGANPNMIIEQESFKSDIIHMALLKYRLDNVVALLIFGASLDSKDDHGNTPLVYARLAAAKNAEYSFQRDAYQAECELIEAVEKHKLDPHRAYSFTGYMAMGLSLPRAVDIQYATEKVNEAIAQCMLDDLKYEHPGQSLSKLVLDRELGKAARRRK